eukprot:4739102-Amphidinium_carterae.1
MLRPTPKKLRLASTMRCSTNFRAVPHDASKFALPLPDSGRVITRCLEARPCCPMGSASSLARRLLRAGTSPLAPSYKL